ncbi:alcohol dehydrogenase (NADP(+)) OS=Streptomyces cyaneofuscatus OX=66883 GN=G3I52_01895 PE=3 SV=1 [Streptomyces cyaneofuscatus]
MGAPEEPISLNLFSLIGGNKSIAGSAIGGIAEPQEMLDFCAVHGLRRRDRGHRGGPGQRGDQRVLASDDRYRFVIDTATI